LPVEVQRTSMWASPIALWNRVRFTLGCYGLFSAGAGLMVVRKMENRTSGGLQAAFNRL
jgi:hypothetical protein